MTVPTTTPAPDANPAAAHALPQEGTVEFYADYIRARALPSRRGVDSDERIDWTALAWIDTLVRHSTGYLTDAEIVARARNVLTAAEQVRAELRAAR